MYYIFFFFFFKPKNVSSKEGSAYALVRKLLFTLYIPSIVNIVPAVYSSDLIPPFSSNHTNTFFPSFLFFHAKLSISVRGSESWSKDFRVKKKKKTRSDRCW